MKKFINKKTGLVEIVTNPDLLEQYEKSEIFKPYEVKKVAKKATKPATKKKTNKK